MATLTLELPPHKTQTEFNLRRWTEILADHQLAKIEGLDHGFSFHETELEDGSIKVELTEVCPQC